MKSLKLCLVVGIFCLLCNSLASIEEDYTRRPAVYEMRDAIHQVKYNYPSRPSKEPSYEVPVPTPIHSRPQYKEEVTTLDRFYRVSANGTIEFKIALSDGQINHQKIYNKIVNGRTIQVFDGYYTVRLADGRYRTTYYRADEMGYRLLGFNVDTMPPAEWRGHEKDNMA